MTLPIGSRIIDAPKQGAITTATGCPVFQLKKARCPGRNIRPKGGARAAAGGFTLIELLLVLVVMSIIAALVATDFSHSYGRIRLGKSADDLAFLMRYAQSRAITLHKPHQIVFMDNFSKYRLMRASNNPSDPKNPFEPLAHHWGRVFTVPQDIHVTSDQPHIQFYPDGHIDKATLELTYAQTSKVITTALQRGYVLVYDGQ